MKISAFAFVIALSCGAGVEASNNKIRGAEDRDLQANGGVVSCVKVIKPGEPTRVITGCPEEKNVETPPGGTGGEVRAPGGTDGTCSSVPMCAALALEGNCCPTNDGIFLDCCIQTCAAHPDCAHLDGDCCPTVDGVILDCCDKNWMESSRQGRNAGDGSCKSVENCDGLAGDCCPTIDGVELYCCSD